MQVFSSEYCEIFKETFFYRTHLVAVLKQVESHQLLMILTSNNEQQPEMRPTTTNNNQLPLQRN